MTTAIKGILFVAAVALPLAGCGVKSSPQSPGGGDYPRTYPAPDSYTGTSSTSPGAQAQPAARRKDGRAYSPLGFPLEYPNRPSY